MIKAVIIDDVPAMREVNSRYLKEFFPEVELAGCAGSVEQAKMLIVKESPQLVILDIELGANTSFDLLESLKPYDFKVVFVSGYDSYALKAIKFSAIEYILKPIVETEFKAAIEKAIDEINRDQVHHVQDQYLLDTIRKEMAPKKLVLKTTNSLHLINMQDILYCRSDNSYTTFFVDNGERIIVSKSLKDYEDLLKGHQFFRPHQSYLVNLNYVKKIDKADGGFVVMKNKKEIPVSVRQKKRMISLLEKL